MSNGGSVSIKDEKKDGFLWGENFFVLDVVVVLLINLYVIK